MGWPWSRSACSAPGAALFRPAVLGLGAVVAVLASVIPYSLELAALRRVTPRAFGVMMSLDPALATAAGFLVLGQQLTLQEWVALALVVGANVGNTLAGRPGAVALAPPAGGGRPTVGPPVALLTYRGLDRDSRAQAPSASKRGIAVGEGAGTKAGREPGPSA